MEVYTITATKDSLNEETEKLKNEIKHLKNSLREQQARSDTILAYLMAWHDFNPHITKNVKINSKGKKEKVSVLVWLDYNNGHIYSRLLPKRGWKVIDATYKTIIVKRKKETIVYYIDTGDREI